MSLGSVCSCAAIAGVASHLGYFIHGEHHQEAPVLARLALLAIVLVFGLNFWGLQLGIVPAAGHTTAILASYAVPLWSSMIIYRLFFHRLRAFPGPLLARVSKIWHSYHTIPRLDGFRFLWRMHEEYGDFVRTGPNELSVFDPAAVPILYGPQSKCTKGPWYDATLPLISMQTVRDKKVHSRRRRIWDRGLNAKGLLSCVFEKRFELTIVKALRNYEDRVMDVSQVLVSQMTAHAGKVINMSQWLLWFSFDVMGQVAFGKSYDVVKNGKQHVALDVLHKGVIPLAVISPIHWVLAILSSLPGNPFQPFIDLCAEQVEERKKVRKQPEA